MEKGLIYTIIALIILILIIAGSIKNGLHFSKLFMSLISLFLLPGLFNELVSNLIELGYYTNILYPIIAGLIIGLILYNLVLKRFCGFLTFEHELSHAIIALFFLRRIYRFVVTRYEGGYIEFNRYGFGGKFGNHLVALAPYYLPTFTLISAIARPFLPNYFFPWFDAWIGFTISFQIMSNIEEIKNNWTKEWFRNLSTDEYTQSDIGHEGYIFSFLIIITFKLLLYNIIIFILIYHPGSFIGWILNIPKNSIDFYTPLLREILGSIQLVSLG